ncbi:c-type cytochrome [Pseudooceanicola nanhaiensis]|uniref:c-type cytochrome n=1 Tax=Pseudooceanicola nanhaiensis TaxID=375761 RepID=UPI001CD25D19|nr:c-type cytochrome [Pseudooceanicola nanhaiensis]MCA0921728.1 cytochrome c [Pseudooceanicola nanhaiensis]
MTRAFALTATAIVLIALGATGAVVLRSAQSRAAPAPLLPWTDSEIVARGEVLYEAQCTACHGSLAATAPVQETSAPPHDENGHSWEHPDYALFQLTKSGEVAELCRSVEGSDMPQFADALTDRQIVDVLSYIKSTWPEETRQKQEAVNLLYATQNAAVREIVARSGE